MAQQEALRITGEMYFLTIIGDAGEQHIRRKSVKTNEPVNEETVRKWNRKGEFPEALIELYVGTEVEEVKLRRAVGVRPDDVPEDCEEEWRLFRTRAQARAFASNDD